MPAAITSAPLSGKAGFFQLLACAISNVEQPRRPSAIAAASPSAFAARGRERKLQPRDDAVHAVAVEQPVKAASLISSSTRGRSRPGVQARRLGIRQLQPPAIAASRSASGGTMARAAAADPASSRAPASVAIKPGHGIDAPFLGFRQNLGQHAGLAHPQQRPARIAARQAASSSPPRPARPKASPSLSLAARAGPQPLGIRPTGAVTGEEPEEPQDAQIVLGDARRRHRR